MTEMSSLTRWDTVLVANRGEIACRVIRAARALGLRTVAVFSDADREAPHVKLADVAVRLGPAEATSSYLNLDLVLKAAQETSAGAIHPGYGFFSENPALPTRCAEAGITWVGPPIEAIKLMGDKRAARVAVAKRGVAVVPGYDGEDQRDERLIEEATRIGFPLMVKASMGGGGKGMRLVREAAEVALALETARREASAAFGDGELILERAVINPKHIEVQVFADQQGSVVHLGERECSLQRRHQKVIEEAPSPALTPELRAEMGAAAVEVARSVGYVGAGTVEFLLDVESREFYFLEMNTRIQVEHPVTEEVYGVDLVAWQLEIARGAPLPLTQEELDARLSGHAIEARLYAEDPARDFMPQAGEIYAWRPPTGRGIRVDDGVGPEVSASYDPMLAKVIARGPDREVARRRLLRALDELILLGPNHNIAFLKQLLELPAFIEGTAHTRTIDDAAPPKPRSLPSGETQALAAIALSAPLSGDAHLRDGWGSGRRSTWMVSLSLDLSGYDITAAEGEEGESEATSTLQRAQRWRVTQLGADHYQADLLADPQGLAQDPNDDAQQASQQTSWTMSSVRLSALAQPADAVNSASDAMVISFMSEGTLRQYAIHLGAPPRSGVGSLSGHPASGSVGGARGGSMRRELTILNERGDQLRFADVTYELEPPEGSEANDLQLRAPMSGKVIAVRCEPGQRVSRGDTLVILEAMKLEHQLTASRDGVARELCVALGDQVSAQQILIELDEPDQDDS